jgi:hypothetical protein
MSSNNKDKQLSVTYNDETLSFEFKLREDGDDQEYELVND